MGRMSTSATTCSTACGPVPKTTSSAAFDPARRSAATAETAGVRSAVRLVPSMIAVGVSVRASISTYVAWMRARPTAGFSGATEATFTPTQSSDVDAMSSRCPDPAGVLTRSGSAAGSKPRARAASMSERARRGLTRLRTSPAGKTRGTGSGPPVVMRAPVGRPGS
jgi:hypothetical protein